MRQVSAEHVTTTIFIRDLTPSCSTRARGRNTYGRLRDEVWRVCRGEPCTVSFAGAGFVSPSFLDETVVRLVEEYRELRGRLTVEDLSGRAVQGLKKVLEIRRVPRAVSIIEAS